MEHENGRTSNSKIFEKAKPQADSATSNIARLNSATSKATTLNSGASLIKKELL